MRSMLAFILLVLAFWCAPVPAGAQSIDRYHPRCTGTAVDPQGPDCTAAIHRYCSQNDRPANAGVLQGFSVDSTTRKQMDVACVQASWYGDASVAELAAEVPGCNAPRLAYTTDCISAIHRWCWKRHAAGGGAAQELGVGVIGVACFATTWYGDVSVSDQCTRNSRDIGCIAHVGRFCRQRANGSVGIPQEIGAHVLGTACFKAVRLEKIGIPAPID